MTVCPKSFHWKVKTHHIYVQRKPSWISSKDCLQYIYCTILWNQVLHQIKKRKWAEHRLLPLFHHCRCNVNSCFALLLPFLPCHDELNPQTMSHNTPFSLYLIWIRLLFQNSSRKWPGRTCSNAHLPWHYCPCSLKLDKQILVIKYLANDPATFSETLEWKKGWKLVFCSHILWGS